MGSDMVFTSCGMGQTHFLCASLGVGAHWAERASTSLASWEVGPGMGGAQKQAGTVFGAE
jgi:hypothetical protein